MSRITTIQYETAAVKKRSVMDMPVYGTPFGFLTVSDVLVISGILVLLFETGMLTAGLVAFLAYGAYYLLREGYVARRPVRILPIVACELARLTRKNGTPRPRVKADVVNEPVSLKGSGLDVVDVPGEVYVRANFEEDPLEDFASCCEVLESRNSANAEATRSEVEATEVEGGSDVGRVDVERVRRPIALSRRRARKGKGATDGTKREATTRHVVRVRLARR